MGRPSATEVTNPYNRRLAVLSEGWSSTIKTRRAQSATSFIALLPLTYQLRRHGCLSLDRQRIASGGTTCAGAQYGRILRKSSLYAVLLRDFFRRPLEGQCSDTRFRSYSRAQWLAYVILYRRLASSLTTNDARLGAIHVHRSGLASPTPCRSPGASLLSAEFV